LARTLTLGTFTAAEAMVFWEQRLGVGEQAEREALASALGYLPLAVEQAAAFMLKRHISPTAYLTRFQERRAALWAREDPPDNYHATVATTWAMAFDHAKQTTGAAELLILCSFFAPDDIPLGMIRADGELLPATLATVVADEDAFDDALLALRDYSLVLGGVGQLSMHRLVQVVARERLGAAEQQQWGAVAIELLIAILPEDSTHLHEWEGGKQILPHMMAVAEWGMGLDWESERLALLCNQTGYYLYFLGDYAGTRLFFERALAIWEKQLGAEHPDTATSLNNLGLLLYNMGAYGEARPLYERALAIREKQLGAAHPQTATSLNNLGGLLQAMGAYGEARPYHERALAIFEKQLGAEHPHTATSLNNLGALLRAMGAYGEARPYYERALAIREKQLGAEHPQTATSLNNLAILAYDEGDMGEAARLMRQALGIREKVLGGEHPQTQSARESLAVIEAALSTTG
jgi:tetratricopeptide (TPR) repeat protein